MVFLILAKTLAKLNLVEQQWMLTMFLAVTATLLPAQNSVAFTGHKNEHPSLHQTPKRHLLNLRNSTNAGWYVQSHWPSFRQVLRTRYGLRNLDR